MKANQMQGTIGSICTISSYFWVANTMLGSSSLEFKFIQTKKEAMPWNFPTWHWQHQSCDGEVHWFFIRPHFIRACGTGGSVAWPPHFSFQQRNFFGKRPFPFWKNVITCSVAFSVIDPLLKRDLQTENRKHKSGERTKKEKFLRRRPPRRCPGRY